ncbi:MAG TPA: glycoside hydrolase family 97 protein [Longimicrobium sp.]|nr:glycoside hydrolase family 97 protein [Longimicrobium sp.]
MPHGRLRSVVHALVLSTTLAAPAAAQEELRVASPDGRNVVAVAVREGGLYYGVQRNGEHVLTPSRLGFAFRGADTLRDSLRITGSSRNAVDQAWTQPWGEVARVRDHHNELRVQVQEARSPGRRFEVIFRAFDDGVAFRYVLGEGIGDFQMEEELTEFALADNARAWWIPSNRPEPDRQEILYSSSPVSRLDSVHTPLTLQMTNGTQVVIHEAELVDYAGMYLARTNNRTLRSTLARWADGVAVRGRAPFVTPWRTIQLADRVEELAPSLLTLKLNPPSRIADTRWITPMKYNGIWWGMHINVQTWGQGPQHGATTANAKRYLDFAAANGLGGTLVEGWNLGWDTDWFNTMKADFSFTQAYPDFDLPEVARYARSKGLTLIGHHETATMIDNYERQLDSAMALYERVGVRAVKTGYVGDRTEHGHAHQSQFMVRHHRRVIETAARHGIMVNVHEPIKDTGERRTWPNILSREGARGMEYNAWGGEGGNPPEHETILFFTRMLSGPMDFTPGIFDILIQRPTGTPRRPEEARPRTTLAKQLALYVVLYSPLQMAADLPENYEGQPAFQFIRDVAVDWDTTIVVDGEIGDHVIVARKTKGKDEWFLGAITDEEARAFDVPLGFLPAGRRYVAEIYADGPGADWRDNPLPVAIRQQPVDASTTLRIEMVPGGGQAVRIRPAR